VSRVDVLAVMSAACDLDPHGNDMAEARAAVAELIAAVNDYAQSYMVDEAEDPDVCGSESQHQQARRVMDALANIGSAP
jgi:hypothetical protein